MLTIYLSGLTSTGFIGPVFISIGQYVSASVGQLISVLVFLKTAHRIFLKLCMKLEDLKGKKTVKAKLFRQILILAKKLKNSPKVGFIGFFQKFNPLMSFFYPKNVHNNVLYDSTKATCLGKSSTSLTAQNAVNQMAGFFL